MNAFRVYVDGHTSIASGIYQDISVSNSSTLDFFYGGGGSEVDTSTAKRNAFSRHLLTIDLTDLRSKFTSFQINSANTVSYKLKLKNSIPSEILLTPEFEFNRLEKSIAQSYDLICFQMDRNFDISRGVDFDQGLYLVKQANTNLVFTGYANFLSASTTVGWRDSGGGVFTNPTASTNYSIQHFQTGGEDIEFDVTTIIQGILNTGGTTANLGLCFGRTWELTSGNTRYLASFYSDKTNTSYKPYLELNYNQVIRDDRHQVVVNRPSKLYLYTFSGNSAVNFYSSSTVSIKTNAGVDVYTGLTPTHEGLGVYSITVHLSAATKGQKYKDVWNDVTFVPGVDQTDFTQTFIISDNNYYTNNAREINDFVVDIYGIDNNTILQTDEILRVYAQTRVAYSTNQPFVEYGLEYKLELFSGTDVLIDWTPLNSATINNSQKFFFDLDCSWLLSGQSYKISFRINELGTKRILNGSEIVFRVQDPITS